MTIAIADDTPDVLETTAMVLEAAGHEVRTVGHAGEILATLVEHRPDVLLQDVSMPELDLDELLPQIRSTPELEGMRVVLFTGRMPSDAELARWTPDDVLVKPFEVAELRGLMAQMDRVDG